MSFFAFQTGDSSRAPAPSDSSPLLGRFRAVPDQHRARRNSFFNTIGRRRSYYGVFGSSSTRDEDSGTDTDGDEDSLSGGGGGWAKVRRGARRVNRRVKGMGRLMRDLWLEPKQGSVANVVERWWWRGVVLVGLPAALVRCYSPTHSVFPQVEY